MKMERSLTSNIRLASLKDLGEILEVYEESRKFMAENGNPLQWGLRRYPQEDVLREDIALGRLFVLERNGRIAGAFVLFIGDEPTYAVIRGGKWPDDRPYMTVHRLGSRRDEHGVAKEALDFAVKICKEKGLGLRADTHADNRPVQHILLKYGFEYCGIITVTDGTERFAYQYRF